MVRISRARNALIPLESVLQDWRQRDIGGFTPGAVAANCPATFGVQVINTQYLKRGLEFTGVLQRTKSIEPAVLATVEVGDTGRRGG
jgi:hypothetical protein